MKKVIYVILFLVANYSARAQCKYIWANWTDQGSTSSAVASMVVNGTTINMNMNANYGFSFTPGIYGYSIFTAYSDPPVNGTVPRITWAAGSGGQTTMCFSQPVFNPVLLLASIGSGNVPVSLSFSVPYTVLFNGGNTTFTNSTTLNAAEGNCIIEFPGTFTCVTIYSSTPENYTNLTWGIKNPLTANFNYTNLCLPDSAHFVSTSSINPPGAIVSYGWNFGDGGSSTDSTPTHLYASGGVYRVLLKVTSDNLCTDTISFLQSVNPSFSINNPQTICAGQVYSFNQHNYNSTGTYYDTLTTVNGCDSIIVTPLTVTSVVYQNNPVSICQGEQYQLPGGTIVNSTGIYNDTLQTASGCDSVIITNLMVNSVPLQNVSASICAGTAYQLPGGGVANTAGTYTDTLQTTLGCDSIIITDLTITQITMQSVSDLFCLGNSYQLPGGESVTNAGVYQDTLQTSTGCDSIITTTLSFLTPLQDSLYKVDPTCYGSNDAKVDLFCLNGAQPYSFRLTGNATNGTGVFSALSPGNYAYTITDSKGCSISGNCMIDQPDEILVSALPKDTSIEPDAIVQLNGSSNYPNVSFRWTPNTFLSCDTCASPVSSPGQSITYNLTATLAGNSACMAEATTTIRITSKIFAPNAFSPNGDGNNDTWLIAANNVKLFNVKIFDRWGEKVFESNDTNQAWDGTFRGKPIGAGVYIYQCTVVNTNNETRKLHGGVTLIR